MQLDLQRYHY